MGSSGFPESSSRVLITGSSSKTWGYTSRTPERHDVPMAPLDSFVQLKTTEDGEPILPEYAFALCLPGSWPFPSLMDQTILPESYLSEGNPGGEETNTDSSTKKTCKRKGKKTQRRSKSTGAVSSASEISPARVKTNTQADKDGTQQVLQELNLSSKGSDSDASEGTGETSKGADPDNSGMGPPIPSKEPRALPRTLSLDQVPGESEDTPTPTQQEVNPANPNTSAQDPLPMPAEQTQSPGPSVPDTSATAASGLGQAPLKDVFVIPTTSSAAQTNDGPDANSIAGVMAGLKEVCNIMTTGFQHACLNVETIVHWSLEGATQLNRRLAEAASQDLNTWASALQPVLDSAGVSDADMEARQGLARKTGREVSNWILSLPHLVTGNPHILGEPVKSALLESFAVANAQCSHSSEEVANQVPDIMTRHVSVDQTQTFLMAVHQLLCSQYQALTTMMATQTSPPVHLGMYSWGAQASLTRSFTQVILALGSLEHTMLVNPSFSAQPTPLPQEERSARAVSADTTVYTPIPPPGSVNVSMSEFPSGTTQGSANLPICVGGNETDSSISSVSHSTQVKPRGLDQHLTSTPKTQPKLMQAELSAKWQGAPHRAHIQDREGSTRKGWGGGFWGWQAPSKIRNASLDSSVVSLDDHTQLSTKLLMERDDPTRNRGAFSGWEDILSVNDSSDIEMTSVVDVLAHPSRDSTPVTGSEDEGEMPANDPGSGGHPDSNPEYDSGNEDSPSGSDSGSSSDPPGSNDDDEFGDMFSPGGTLQPIKRKPESQAQSNSCSQSRESEPHK